MLYNFSLKKIKEWKEKKNAVTMKGNPNKTEETNARWRNKFVNSGIV